MRAAPRLARPAQPRLAPAPPSQPHEGEEDGEAYPSNIMFDRRVVRGSTYAARVLPAEPALLPKPG